MVGLRLGLVGNWRPTRLGITREARVEGACSSLPARQKSDLSSQARHFFLERDDFGSPVEQLDTAPGCRPYYECERNQASDRIVAHDSPASVSVVTVLSPAECNAIRYQRAAPSRKWVSRIEAVLTNGGQGILRVAVA